MSLVRQQCSQVTNGVASGLFPLNTNLGIYNQPLKWYSVYPLAPDSNLIADNQSVTVGSYITLAIPDNAVTIGNTPVIQLDCQRLLTFTANASQNSTVTFLINGYDDQQQACQIQYTYPANTTSAQNVLRGLSYVASIQCTAKSGTFTSTFDVGTGNGIALPEHVCLTKNYVLQFTWDDINYGPAVPGDSIAPLTAGYNWRSNTLNATMTDPRGYVILPSAPDGETLFTILYYVYGADSQLRLQFANNDPNCVSLIGGYAQLPDFIAYDETGMQYPAQSAIWQHYFG